MNKYKDKDIVKAEKKERDKALKRCFEECKNCTYGICDECPLVKKEREKDE